MRYLDPERDEKILRALVEAEVIRPADLTGMDQPSEGHLLDMLIANGDRIRSDWVLWLIRYHRMWRVHRPRIRSETLAELRPGLREKVSELVRTWRYPLGVDAGVLWCGMVVPDHLLPELSGAWKGQDICFMAVTPGEAQTFKENYGHL